MKDCFALLGVPRRPWVESELLNEKFLVLSGDCHPDRVHHANEADKRDAQDRFTQLNAAYQSLLDPRERVLHLLELETGGKTFDIQSIPADLMSLFLDVGKLCREADAFLSQKGARNSPLLKVEMFERAQTWIESLRDLQARVMRWREALLEELRKLDTAWAATDATEKPAILRGLLEIAGFLNYSKKWNAQIEERLLQLMM